LTSVRTWHKLSCVCHEVKQRAKSKEPYAVRKQRAKSKERRAKNRIKNLVKV